MREALSGSTEKLARLAIEMYARGLAVRDSCVVNSEFKLRQLEELRNDLNQELKQRKTAFDSVASRHRIYSKDRT